MKKKNFIILAAMLTASPFASSVFSRNGFPEGNLSSISCESQPMAKSAQLAAGWYVENWTPETQLSPGGGLAIECFKDSVVLSVTEGKCITKIIGIVGLYNIDVDVDTNADANRPVLAPSLNRNTPQESELWKGKARRVTLPYGENLCHELTITYADEAAIEADTIVSVNPQQLEIGCGTNKQLSVYYTLEGEPRTDVTWAVDDNSVAFVNDEGLVTALREGTTVIRATTLDGRNLSGICEVQVTKATFTLNLDLTEGWNWISCNLYSETLQTVSEFIKPIQDNLKRFVGFDTELIKDSQLGFVGQLKEISPETCYQIQVGSNVNQTWTSLAYTPEKTPITLRKGWNWLGYVPMFEQSLEEALSNFTPSEDDVVKSYDGFSVYNDGKWTGTLTTMKPGYGYMYFSSQDTEFCYPSGIQIPGETFKAPHTKKNTANNTPWNVMKHKYPHNMTLIAEIKANDDTDSWTIGAFVGNECRGIGQMVEGKFFITVYGDSNSNEQITFKAYNADDKCEIELAEYCVFSNAMVGSFKSPFVLSNKSATGITELSIKDEFNISMDPSQNVLHVKGLDELIRYISIASPNGQIVYETQSYKTDGLNISELTSGLYIITIKTEKRTISKKIIKKQTK